MNGVMTVLTAVFFCKTSAFSYKYILNEIQDMTSAVLCKYITCTVDKLLALALIIIIIIIITILIKTIIVIIIF